MNRSQTPAACFVPLGVRDNMMGTCSGDNMMGTCSGDKTMGTCSGDKRMSMCSRNKMIGMCSGDKMMCMCSGDKKMDMSNGDKRMGTCSGDNMMGTSSGDKTMEHVVDIRGWVTVCIVAIRGWVCVVEIRQWAWYFVSNFERYTLWNSTQNMPIVLSPQWEFLCGKIPSLYWISLPTMNSSKTIHSSLMWADLLCHEQNYDLIWIYFFKSEQYAL